MAQFSRGTEFGRAMAMEELIRERSRNITLAIGSVAGAIIFKTLMNIRSK